MTQRRMQPDQRPADEFDADLHPDPHAGLNTSESLPDGTPTAYDHPDIHRSLVGFTDDELKRIPILPSGTRLQQGAVYLDLLAPERSTIKAFGVMEAAPFNAYVPKSEVDYQLFNRLLGEDNPERTGEASE